jgi:hypothetical protein
MSRNGSALNLHILVPGLLGNLAARSREAKNFPRFTHIESLLARSYRSRNESMGYETQLCAMFGLHKSEARDLPLGPVRRFGITGSRDEDYFLCADPVHLRADMKRVLLLDSTQFDMRRQEAKAFAELFNGHFGSEGLCLAADDICHWHLRLNRPHSLHTPSLREVRGSDISGRLPGGKSGTYWRALLNELQMLYHDADMNRRRGEQGKLVINSLWLYGAGSMPTLEKQPWTAAWASDTLVAGLSRLADVELHALPQGLETVISSHSKGSHLIGLDDVAIASSYDDLTAWEDGVRYLERDWFAPLSRALKARDVGEAMLYDCAGQQFRLRGSDRWKFWHNSRSLNEMVLDDD